MACVLLLTVVLQCICILFTVNAQPEQIHLSGTGDPTSMILTWASPQPCDNTTIVSYSISNTILDTLVNGSCYNFTEANPNGTHHYHKVSLAELSELTDYYYTVSSAGFQSQMYSFRTLSSDPNWIPKFMIFGDLGHRGGAIEHESFTALPSMKNQVKQGNVDLIFHAGDFAYDLHSDGGSNGDHFFKMIEPMAATKPYMTIVGNHEIGYNFTHYRHRFAMPRMELNDGFDMWYSFDIGQMHIIAFSTEVIFARPQDMQTQLDWIENDLIAANKNREERPWVVTIGHRPIYCSNADEDCIFPGSAGTKVQKYVEDLFYKYGVDIEIWAHEHSYERTWPVYNFNVTQKDYNNPNAPIHLITGAAGCNESDGLCLNPILRSKGEWSAFRTEGIFHPYSYGFLEVYNKTHAYFNQINAQENEIYDEIFIVANSHGPFPHY